MLKISRILLLLTLEYRLFVISNADECSLNTECRRIRDCPYILANYNHITIKPYCNGKDGRFVCCPIPPPKYVQPKDEELRVVRECKSYQSVRPKCEEPLIVGGQKAKPKEYPFMALLSYKKGHTHKWACGGTLISAKFVLTAAHCFYLNDNPNNVRLGELNYNSTDDDAYPLDFDIKGEPTIHPDYSYTTKFNDIALAELDGLVPFNDYIMPACLPLADGRKFDEFIASGWGSVNEAGPYSSHLLKVKLESFDDTCLERIDRKAHRDINTTIQMCAGSSVNKSDTCSGDSGGPLFVSHPDYKCMFIVLGVTSYSHQGCANVNYPAFYTRISSYVKWIEGIVWQ